MSVKLDRSVIFGAVITAIATILAGLVSGLVTVLVAPGQVDARVDEIAEATMQLRETNTVYHAPRAGLVVVRMRATNDDQFRHVDAYGKVNEIPVASGAAQNGRNNPDMPSITDTSFTMPVAKNDRWVIETKKDPQVEVRWFSPVPLASSE